MKEFPAFMKHPANRMDQSTLQPYTDSVATRHKGERAGTSGNPFYSWLGILVLGVMALGPLGSFWASWHADQERLQWSRWPSVKGSPSDTRITEHAITEFDAKKGLRPWYVGECRVQYSVAGKEYSVWTDADRDSDSTQLANRMRTCPFSSYDVHYDPNRPWIAHAFLP